MKRNSKFKIQSSNLKDKAKKIKLLILDVDGVMTDGSIILDNMGNEIKAFHVRDGHGIKIAKSAGLEIAIITGRESKVVERRAIELGIDEVHQMVRDKVETYEKIIRKHRLKDEEVAFIGDDINDYPLLRRVGLSITVADADGHIRKAVDRVTKKGGGKGAVRETIEMILKAQGKWKDVAGIYMAENSSVKPG